MITSEQAEGLHQLLAGQTVVRVEAREYGINIVTVEGLRNTMLDLIHDLTSPEMRSVLADNKELIDWEEIARSMTETEKTDTVIEAPEKTDPTETIVYKYNTVTDAEPEFPVPTLAKIKGDVEELINTGVFPRILGILKDVVSYLGTFPPIVYKFTPVPQVSYGTIPAGPLPPALPAPFVPPTFPQPWPPYTTNSPRTSPLPQTPQTAFGDDIPGYRG